MKNGCPKCEKMPDDKLCDSCELDMLRAAVDVALHSYKDKLNKMKLKLKKESEVKK